MNIQGWFPLGLTGLLSLLSKGDKCKTSTSQLLDELWGGGGGGQGPSLAPRMRRWSCHPRCTWTRASGLSC